MEKLESVSKQNSMKTDGLWECWTLCTTKAKMCLDRGEGKEDTCDQGLSRGLESKRAGYCSLFRPEDDANCDITLGATRYPFPGLPIERALVVTRLCWSRRDRIYLVVDLFLSAR